MPTANRTRKVIVNADDFGMSSESNRDIVEAFDKGIISSTTLMANMPGFDEACELAHLHGLVGKIGVHLNLTSGFPLSSPIKRCSRFCDETGRFRARQTCFYLSKAERHAIETEFAAQVQVCIDRGIRPTHLDSHHHVHTEWPIGAAAIKVARDYGIRAIRLSRNCGSGMKFFYKLYKLGYNTRLRMYRLAKTQYFGSAVDAQEVISTARGDVEVMVHLTSQDLESIHNHGGNSGIAANQLVPTYSPPVPSAAPSSFETRQFETQRYSIVHMTSVHDPLDVRIFQKECRSLAKNGYRVSLIVPHRQSETVQGVQLRVVPQAETRLSRMTFTVWRVYREALRQDADLYHFHDPELIPVGLLLKATGKRVIYDAHEWYAAKILSKLWIPLRLRRVVSHLFSVFERVASTMLDHVITADRFTASTFGKSRVSVIANYPSLASDQEHFQRAATARAAIYVGELTIDRGLGVMLEIARLLQDTDFELRLMGHFTNPEDERQVRAARNVRYFGRQPHEAVLRELAKADVGLVLLQPVPAYYYAGENTVKLFEYMSRGLPVVVSNFPNLKRIVETANCGLCVDPRDSQRAAAAICTLLCNQELRHILGENGRKAVAEEYNWEGEVKTLLRIYQDVLSGASREAARRNSIASA